MMPRLHGGTLSGCQPTFLRGAPKAALGIVLEEKRVQGEGQGTQRQRHLAPYSLRRPAASPPLPSALGRGGGGDLQQGLLHDLSEGWVDIERAMGQLVDRFPEARGV